MKRLKGSLIIFVISAVICVPLLIFAGKSGEGNVLNYVLYVLCAAAAVLMLVFSLSSPEYPSFFPNGKRSPGAGLVSLVAAVAYGAIGVYGFINPEKRLIGKPVVTVETTIDSGGQVVSNVTSSSGSLETAGIVYIAIMLVMAVVFLFYAVSFFTGNNHAGSYVMVPFIPILGAMVRVVLSFLEYTGSPKMSANYLEVLTMVFLMLFFVSSAKLTVGSAGNSSKWAVGTGSAAMFFVVLNSVAPVMSIINKEQSFLSAAAETHFIADIALVFFIAGYCIYIVNTDVEDYLEEIDEDEDDGYGGPVSSKPTLLTGRGTRRDDRYIPEIVTVTPVLPSAQTKAPGMQVAKSGTAYSAPVPPRRDGVPTGRQQPQSRQRAGYSAPVPPRRVPIGYRLEADELTTRGAGMQVADQFRVQRNEARRRTSNLLRYDGLDAFRSEMKGGRTALDILESSRNVAVEEDTSLIGIKPINPFENQNNDLSAEPTVDPAEAQKMGEDLQKDVEEMYDKADRRKGGDRRKGENVGGRRSTDKQPEDVMVAPDEAEPEIEIEETVTEEPEREYRDVKLSDGSLDSKMKKQRRASDKNAQQPNMQQNPYQQPNMNGMGMGYGMGMGMGMGYGMGMGMGMNNPYDPYAGMGMNNPYNTNPYAAANPYTSTMGQMPFGTDMYNEDTDGYDEDEYYYDDDYDVETADSEEYDEEYDDVYDEEYDEGYDEEYEEEYYDDDNYVEYGDEYEDYDEYGEYEDYDEYDDYDEGDEYYADDDSDYYDDDDGYGTYDMSAQGWE